MILFNYNCPINPFLYPKFKEKTKATWKPSELTKQNRDKVKKGKIVSLRDGRKNIRKMKGKRNGSQKREIYNGGNNNST